MNYQEDSEETGTREPCLWRDSRASHSVAQEKDLERMMTATSGRRCCGSLERYGPVGLLVRTLLESSRWYSPAMRLRWEATRTLRERVTRRSRCVSNPSLSASAPTSNPSDIPSSRSLYRLVPSARPTEGTGYGSLLPTATAQDFKRRGPNSRQQGLPEAASDGLLPTPNAGEGTKWTTKYNPDSQMGQGLTALAVNGMLPTPTANDGQNSMLPPSQAKRKSGVATMLAKSRTGKTSLQLNPLFVSEMMGFPLDYLVSPFQSGEANPSEP